MKISRKIRKGYALALAFLLVLPCLVYIRTEAAVAIDTEAKCSLTVSVEGSEYEGELDELSIPVSLYRTADVDKTGRYTPEAPFTELDFGSISDKTTAEDWRRMSEEAERHMEEAEPVKEIEVKKPEEGTGKAEGVFENLNPGMYLVAPAEIYNTNYSVKYVFTPYLTALPSSEYTLTGTGSDEWNYNPKVGFKAESEEQYGKLNITKILNNYNETLGKTSFVFEITSRENDSAGNPLYSNVVSTTHEGPGEQTVTLEGLPAGITVTVKEVYSGASYTLDGAGETDALIWSDKAVEEGAGETASVTFRNKYDGGNRGGYGVTNHFASDGNNGWTWENPTQGLPEENN